MKKKVFIFIADGFEEVETVTPFDYLKRAGAETLLVGVSGSTVTGSHGLRIQADLSLEQAKKQIDSCNLVVLPGGLPNAETLAASKTVKELVLHVQSKGGLIAGICASPALAFGSWGIVDNKSFTCYPGMGEDLPTKPLKDKRVVKDGRIITACGPGASEEFALTLIETLFDAETKAEVKKAIVAR